MPSPQTLRALRKIRSASDTGGRIRAFIYTLLRQAGCVTESYTTRIKAPSTASILLPPTAQHKRRSQAEGNTMKEQECPHLQRRLGAQNWPLTTSVLSASISLKGFFKGQGQRKQEPGARSPLWITPALLLSIVMCFSKLVTVVSLLFVLIINDHH